MHPRFSVLVGLILIGALLVFAAELIISLQVIAHAGLDNNGCHQDIKSGNDHCHGGDAPGKTSRHRLKWSKMGARKAGLSSSDGSACLETAPCSLD